MEYFIFQDIGVILSIDKTVIGAYIEKYRYVKAGWSFFYCAVFSFYTFVIVVQVYTRSPTQESTTSYKLEKKFFTKI